MIRSCVIHRRLHGNHSFSAVLMVVFVCSSPLVGHMFVSRANIPISPENHNAVSFFSDRLGRRQIQ
jgi:hypothetical protein